MEAASLVASLISALATAVLGVLAIRLTRSSNGNTAERAIGDLANSLARLRVEYPEAIAVARRWQSEDWERLYADRESSHLLLRYYSYVEVGLEFCNTTLRARDARQISSEAFGGHYGRLTRYFLTENWPIVDQMLQAPYLSTYIREEVARGRVEGWDWAFRPNTRDSSRDSTGPVSGGRARRRTVLCLASRTSRQKRMSTLLGDVGG